MAGFQDLVYTLQNTGVIDFLLPFILVFTIVYAILQKIEIFGKEAKNFNVVISLVIGLLFVIPHISGAYPLGYDPVDVINQALPSVSLLAIAIVMVLIIMGLVAPDMKFAKGLSGLLTLFALLFVGYIFGASLGFWQGPYDIFYWWSSDITELLIIILIFGLIVGFITSDPNPNDRGSAKDRLNSLADLLVEKKE